MNSMDSVRDSVDEFRYRWLNVRIGGPDATLQGHWVVLSLSLLVVFACFFAIGRLGFGGGGGGSASATPSALAGPSGQPAVPAGLSGGSPIAGAVPVSIAVQPRTRPIVRPVPRPLRPATLAQSAEPARSETRAPEPQSSAAPLPAPAPVQVAAPAPKPAVKVSAPAPTKVSAPAPAPTKVSAPAPTKAAGSAPSGSSFDTSE
jgi:hypothetical protein